MVPKPIDEPIKDTDGNISIIDLDQIEDDDDDVVEIIDLVSPEKTIHYKKKLIAKHLTETEAKTDPMSDISFPHDFGMSESFIIDEFNRFEADNPNIGNMMDEIVAMLQ